MRSPSRVYAEQRGIEITPEWIAAVEHDVRSAAYQVRELKGSVVHGIGLTVSGLVRCIGREGGTILPVSGRVEDGVCASLPRAIGPDGPGDALWPLMDDAEGGGVGEEPRGAARRQRPAPDLSRFTVP